MLGEEAELERMIAEEEAALKAEVLAVYCPIKVFCSNDTNKKE